MAVAAAPLLATPAAPVVIGAIVVTGVIVIGAEYGPSIVQSMENAAAKARSMLTDAVAAEPCRTCDRKNPCAALAGGRPGAKYKGGAHGMMAWPKGDGLDSHHIPAKAASPLPAAMGPAIQMDPEDHWKTASNGRMPGNKLYIATQRALIAKGEFLAASAMDIADIRAKFPDGKYDDAIAQAEAYTLCLKKNGLVQ